jgi:hypothetical protein
MKLSAQLPLEVCCRTASGRMVAMAESDDSARNQRISFALFGIVLLLATFNAAAQWLFPKDGSGGDYLVGVYFGVLVMEPILFGFWLGLGTGSFAMQLPLAVPCLLLLFMAPGINRSRFADTPRFEFIVTVAVGLAIFAVSTGVFTV